MKINIVEKELNIKLTPEQTELFEIYTKELLIWNENINLTAIRTEEEILLKHFADSLTLLPFIPETTKKLVDIGSGAGFPGIPLAIMRSDIEVTLVESVGKKCKFLEHIKETLSLSNLEIVNARAEEVGMHTDYKGTYDVATARAVTRLLDLTKYALPLLKKDGILLAQKGTKEDPRENENEIRQLGGKIESIEKIETENLKDRVVVKIIKK
ncbi:MAG: rRNA (guanine527-N7)-methyltransferase [Patescibacteria group bacterium]|jgi:16S rRNA (guanine527-N7)-methyltransferase|nr:rRNA (guanine527-N7)-methyltransferase [Patescibacteria group bacterium]